MSTDEFTTAFGYIAALPADQQGHIQALLLKAFRMAHMERQLVDKDKQLAELKADKDKLWADKDKLWADKDKQLDTLIIAKDQIIAFQSTRLAKVEAELLAARSMHAAILTMRPVLEIYMALIYNGKKTTSVGIKELVRSCISCNGAKAQLTQAAHAKMIALEGRDVPGVVNDMEDLMNKLSGRHHHPNHKKGFVCGGQSPLRVATGIVLATAQEMLNAAGNLHLANFDINYCNDAWQVTCAFNDGTIRII